MNYFLVCQSRLWMLTIVLYTCIWIPMLQIKKALVTLLCGGGAMLQTDQWPEIPLLPATRYEDLQRHDCCSFEGDMEDEVCCSICLLEFEGDDVVSKLGRCGHVFHVSCIDGWLHRSHFTCPLCRSFLFSQHDQIHVMNK